MTQGLDKTPQMQILERKLHIATVMLKQIACHTHALKIGGRKFSRQANIAQEALDLMREIK